MTETILSVTEAARNFADCVNRAHYQRQSFLLLKAGIPVARIVPASKSCSGPALAAALSRVAPSPAEARKWQQDRKAARRALSPPPDRWK